MASTRRKLRSRRISFLDLPGELRNNFYKYYFEDDFRCECVAQHHALLDKFTCGETSAGAIASDHLTQILLVLGVSPIMFERLHIPKAVNKKTVRMSRAMGQYMRVHGLQTKWSTSLCPLLLLCKLIHHEVIALFYKKTTMVFAGPKRITNTLQIVPKIHLALITKLDLHYSTYGSPSLFEHSAWQVVHTLSWERACGELIEQLNNIQELQIWIKVNHRPLIFELDQDWLSPIIRFRRLAPVLLKRSSMWKKTSTPSSPRPFPISLWAAAKKRPCAFSMTYGTSLMSTFDPSFRSVRVYQGQHHLHKYPCSAIKHEHLWTQGLPTFTA